MIIVTRKQKLLSGASAFVLAALSPTIATATPQPVKYDTGLGTVTQGYSHTSLTGTTAHTTDIEGSGGLFTGSGSSTYDWNVDADMNSGIVGPGFTNNTSAGTTTTTFTDVLVKGSISSGIYVHTSGTAHAIINIDGASTVQGDNGTSAGSGIVIDSSSSNAVDININGASSEVNAGTSGTAGIRVERSAISSTIDNKGLISGGSSGTGILLEEDGLLDTLNNEAGATIQGGGSAYGIAINSHNASGSTGIGINLITNSGIIQGGSNSGNGIILFGDASVGTISNFGTGHIEALGSNSAGIHLMDTAHLHTLNNENGGIINGHGTGNGVELVDSASIDNITNRGTINGGNLSGNGIYVTGNGLIDDIQNYSTGVINSGDASSGYGILVRSGATGDAATINTITNSGHINSGYDSGNAAIALLGGDNGAGITRVTTDHITNTSFGVIAARNNGYGIEVGNYHTLTTLDNKGIIEGNYSNGIGINVNGHGIITNLNNLTSLVSPFYGRIAGGGAGSSSGTGISVSEDAKIETITNHGDIAATLNGSARGIGIQVINNGSIGTIQNYKTISGGSSVGTGIYVANYGSVHHINNYADGDISGGAWAIQLLNASSTGFEINTAGTINGDIRLGSGGGTGDTLNIYGGAINGDIYGISGEGIVGTVNFDLVGGTFGVDGTSVDGTFTTNGNIGMAGSNVNAVNFNSGTVTLNNDIHSNDITIADGATVTLNNNATFAMQGGDLTNDGTLNLGTHALFVQGNLTGTGTLGLDITPTSGGSHGFIQNDGGTITMTNMLVAPHFDPGAVTPGEKLVIVDGGSTYAFNATNIMSSNGIKWTLSQADASGMDYQNYSYGSGALLATASALVSNVVPTNAGALDPLSSYSGENTDIQALQAGLLDTTDNNQAGAQMRPDANGGGILGALNASGNAQDVISTHLDNFNGGSGVSSGETLKGVNSWMQGFGAFSDQGKVSGVDGFSASSYGATFGADKEVRDSFRLGAAFTYANTNVDDSGTRAGSGEKIDSYIGNIYGTYKASSWYIDGLLTVGDHEYDSTRLVTFVGPTVAKGSFSSQQFGAKAEMGYPIAVSRYTITPLAALAFDTLHQDGYTETGAGGANLVVDDSSVRSYRGTLGAKASTVYELDNGWSIKPIVHLAWKHEFNNDLVPNQDVSFSGGGVSFTTPGLKLPQDAADFGVDADIMSANNLTITARYEGEVRNSYMENTALLKARFGF